MTMTGLHELARFCRKEQARLYEQGLERRRKLQRHKKMWRSWRAASEEKEQRVRQCEDDLASMLLLAAGVRRALLDAGALDKADLAAAIRRMDLADGVADGKLDPAATRPAPQPPLSTDEYLRRLAEKG
ncbi:MAG: hypothetical protein RBS80_08165 [Thermoguttaceae bacterium]|nr:hypothetical protein [Thermoguttaceae bacterium]